MPVAPAAPFRGRKLLRLFKAYGKIGLEDKLGYPVPLLDGYGILGSIQHVSDYFSAVIRVDNADALSDGKPRFRPQSAAGV